jgi:AraC-like DNA-binding protein
MAKPALIGQRRSLAADRDALRSAAAITLDRIRKDEERVGGKLKPLVAYIADHLFSPELTVGQLKLACGIRDNSVALHFHREVGQPPHVYISRARIEVAVALMRQSNLPVWRVSELLGYSSIQVFSRAFFRLTGRRPLSVRKEDRIGVGGNGGAADELEPIYEDTMPLFEDLLRRVGRHELSDAEAAELIRRLLLSYPPTRKGPQRPDEPVDHYASADPH